ncbi:MAG: Rieske 2Fe-2S domain-containing protein [Mariprofundaceae bacterium]|nr:Rieske 2Fe-2S domain-containing protein [Mariprofundaceae bacterium]
MHPDSVQITRWQQLDPPAEGRAVTFTYTEKINFNDEAHEHTYEGFLIRFNDKLRAYRNSCPHMGSPLDWLPGQFFSEDGDQLVCHTHDARFNPADGACISGPCPNGLSELPLRITEQTVEVPAALSE